MYIWAVLFFGAFFFSIIVVDNSYEVNKVYDVLAVNGSVGLSERAESESGLKIVIDPGHGGNDPGKVSPDGILEKDVNLEISFALKTELELRGVEVIMLRTEDKNLAIEGATNKKTSDMSNRVALINETNPDLLISIHQNSFTDSAVRGPQVFYYGNSEKSQAFALILQEELKAINPKYSREAKQGNDYYILHKSICPGVIVECGFLSCPEETALLTSKEYQQKIASAIADAIQKSY